MRKKGQGTSGDQCFFWVMFDTFKKYIKHPAIWQHWTFYRLVVSSCHKLHDNWLVNGDQTVDGFKLFPNICWNMNGIQGWTQKLWIYTMNTQPLHYYAITNHIASQRQCPQFHPTKHWSTHVSIAGLAMPPLSIDWGWKQAMNILSFVANCLSQKDPRAPWLCGPGFGSLLAAACQHKTKKHKLS